MSRPERWAITLLVIAAALMIALCLHVANGTPTP